MFRLHHNKKSHAFIPLTFTTVGLFIATTILLISIYTLIQAHPAKTQTELASLANSFHHHVLSIHSSPVETKSHFRFSTLHQTINIFLTPSSLMLQKHQINKEYSMVKPSLVSWWIPTENATWNATLSFHQWLYDMFGSNGSIIDPLLENETIASHIQSRFSTSQSHLFNHPYAIDTSKPVTIEKVYIYYADSHQNIMHNKTQSFTLVYQYPDSL